MNRLITTAALVGALLAAPATTRAGELEGPDAPRARQISLAEAQQLAARHNPGAKNLSEVVYQADMLVRQAWAMLLPSLSAKGSIVRNQREIALQFPDFSAFDPANPAAPLPTSEVVIQEKWGQSFGFAANMTLFNPRSIPLINNARDNAEISRLAAKRQKNDLLFAVTAAYYQAYALQGMLGVARENVALAQEFDRVSKLRKEAGQGTEIDVLRAELQVLSAQKELANFDDALKMSKSALAHLMGVEGDFAISGPEQIAPLNSDLDSLTERALGDRVDLDEAAVSMTIAERSRSESVMKWLPAFDVTYDWSWSSAEGFSGEHDQWMLIFGARWSLFEGGGRIAEYKARQSQARMASNNIDQLRLDIRLEVEQAYLDVGQHQRNVDLAEKQTKLATENQELVGKQYRAGMATSLDALDAATELHNQRVSRVIERLEFDIAQLSLRKAIGEYHSLSAVTPAE